MTERSPFLPIQDFDGSIAEWAISGRGSNNLLDIVAQTRLRHALCMSFVAATVRFLNLGLESCSHASYCKGRDILASNVLADSIKLAVPFVHGALMFYDQRRGCVTIGKRRRLPSGGD